MTPREISIKLYALGMVQHNQAAKALADELALACHRFELSETHELVTRATAMVAQMNEGKAD